jgi:endonuclease YncB( thermonuclease family)
MGLGVVRTFGSRLALGLFAFALTAQAAPGVVQGVISKVVDGDTVNVDPKSLRRVSNESDYADYAGDEDVKVRMLGIDAPETHFPTPDKGVVGQQPWGDLATAYLKGFLKVGSAVTLQTWGQDKYHRTLGFVFVKKVDINLQMVRGGWAIPYVICSGKTCTRKFFTDNRVRDYLASCDAARKEKRGFFDPSKPLKEMPFEFRMRMANRSADKFVGNYDTLELYEPKDYKQVDVCRRIFFMSKAEALAIGFKPRK